MNTEIITNEITPFLQELVSKLGTTTEYLWGILLKQATVQIYMDIFVITLTVITIILYSIFIYIAMKKKWYDYNSKFNTITLLVTFLGGTIILIMFIASLFCTMELITLYVNPEYWAFEQILDIMKSG